MKKILVCALVLVLCITAFVACNPTTNEGLESAKEYLQTMYEKAAVETGKDFTRPAIVKIGDTTYDVEWTVSITSGPNTITVSEPVKSMVTIGIDEFSAEEIVYTLTATIKDSKGNSTTLTWNHKVPAFGLNTWAEYCAAGDADSQDIITVKGYIVGVNADSGSSSKGSLWIVDETGKGYYAYKPTLDTEITSSRENIEAAFPRGKEVVIKGKVDNYNGCYEFLAGCEIIETGNSVDPATLPYVDATEKFTNATSIDDASLVELQATRVAVNGVTMGAVSGNNYYFTIGDVDFIFYMNIYLLTAEQQNTLKAMWVEGGKANLKGVVNVYSGKYQVYPDSLASLEIVQENLTDAEKVERQAGLITLPETVDANFTLPAGTWADVAWTVAGAGAVIGEDGLAVTVTRTAEDQTVTFTATISSGEAQETKEYSVVIEALIPDDPNTVFLNTKTLGVGSSYGNGTPTVEGIGFSFTELGNYGTGMQMRQKDGKISSICNTTALARPIASIVVVLHADKSVYDNADVFSFKFGTSAEELGAEVVVSTVAGQYEYTITPDAETYTYFSMTKIIASYTFYVDSITINYANGGEVLPQENIVTLTTTSLGLVQSSYQAGSATVDGVGFDYVELGYYENGIQMRQKEGRISSIANTSAIGTGITKIVITLNAGKSVYDNADVFSFKFGTTAAELGAEVLVSTVADQYVYTITPNASTYTYFSMTKVIASYSFYVDSIEIYYAGEVEEPACQHDFANTCDAECGLCGEPNPDYVAGHSYDNACDTTCNICGDTRETEHVDVEDPKCVCDECGATLECVDGNDDNACDNCGAAICAHEYDNACDADCNLCGDARTPADHVDANTDCECDECQAALDHAYDNACDADCNVCGDTRTPADHVFDNNCDADCNVCGAANPDYADHADSDSNGKCDECDAVVTAHAGTEADPYSVADALLIAGALEQGATTTEKPFVIGVIKSIGTPGSYLKNVYITDVADSTKEILVQTVNFTSGVVESVNVGDTVTINGYIKNYNGTLEIVGVGSDYAYFTACTPHTCDMSDATCDEPATCSICGATEGEALGHTDEANSDGECDRCGTNMSTAAQRVTVTASYTASTTGNMAGDGANNASTIGLDASIFTVKSEKLNGGTNHVGLNKAGNMRLYKGETCSLTIEANSGYRIVSIKVTYAGTNASTNLKVTDGTNVLTGDALTYVVNGSKVVLTNTDASGQIHIASIEIVYEPIA